MTVDHVTLVVWGTPRQQGSKSAVVRGGKPLVIEGKSATVRASHKAWRRAVADAARKALDERGGRQLGADGGPHDAPLLAIVALTMPKPKAKPKYLRWHRSMPDVDKLARATLDGIGTDTGLIDDDSRIAALYVTKRYALAGEAPGAVVTLAVLDEDDDTLVELWRDHALALRHDSGDLRMSPTVFGDDEASQHPSLFEPSAYADGEVI